MPAPVYKPGTGPKPATPRGRPCLLTKECEAKLLSAIEGGLPLKQAAMLAGVSYDSMNRWRNKGQEEDAPFEFRHFCKALERSEAVAMQLLVSRIQEGGKTDWRAAAWLLERRHADEFAKPQRIEHTGPGGRPIEAPLTIDHSVLQKIKKQEGIAALAGKLGGILLELKEKDRRRLQASSSIIAAEQ